MARDGSQPRANSPCLLPEDSSDTGHGCRSFAVAVATTVTSETRPVVGSDEQAFDYLK